MKLGLYTSGFDGRLEGSSTTKGFESPMKQAMMSIRLSIVLWGMKNNADHLRSYLCVSMALDSNQRGLERSGGDMETTLAVHRG